MLALIGVLLVFVLIGEIVIMATLADVNTSLAAQTQAIADLAARIPAPQPPPAATEADLDAVKASIDSNTAQIAGLVPAADAGRAGSQ